MKSRISLALFLAAVGLFTGCQPESVSYPLLFGRALFGPDKSDDSAIVHFIVRGDEIFIDLNKDDVPQTDELSLSLELPSAVDTETSATYKIHELRLIVNPKLISETLTQQLAMTVEVSGDVSYRQLGSVVLTEDPSNPDWVHFGPLHIVYTEPEQELKQGRESLLRIWVGSHAVGTVGELGTSNGPMSAASLQADQQLAAEMDETQRFAQLDPVDKELVPEVKIEIPTEDGAPFIQTLLLDHFC